MLYLLWMIRGKLVQYIWSSEPVLGTIDSQAYALGTSLDTDAFLSGSMAQYNQKGNLYDIIFLHAQSLGALDTSEQDSVKCDLMNEQMPKRQAQLESSQCWLQLQVIIDKCTKIHNHVQDLDICIIWHQNQVVQQHRSSQAFCGNRSPSRHNQHNCFPQKSLTISQI